CCLALFPGVVWGALRLPVPAKFGSHYLGEIDVVIEEDEERIEVEPLINRLAPYLTEKGRAALEAAWKSGESLLPPISVGGVEVQYDSDMQEVVVDIAPDWRSESVMSLRGVPRQNKLMKGEGLTPERLSGFMNVSLSETIRHPYFQKYSAQGNFYAGAQIGMNIQRWELDGNFYFSNYGQGKGQKIANKVNRGNVTLKREDPEHLLRYQMGEISSGGGLSPIPLFGLQVSRNPTFFGVSDPNVGPMGEHSFFLNAPSEVGVYVNGVLVRRTLLEAGPHRVKDFPYAGGVNEVELRITGPMGEEEVIDLSAFYAPHLLKKGEYRYTATVGFPRFQQATQQYLYQFKDVMGGGTW
ncbi:MAG: fimbria/pilus outer membrane usher protein, partial [Chlamydiota bacterium]|nr:fimbria/pilus outer membrane usher protein [Chlamydiota bacterium]